MARRQPFFATLALLLAGSALLACSPPLESSEESRVVCTSRVVDHAEACPSEPCAITGDVEVYCEDWDFAATGLHVGPGPDATWLATSSSSDRMIYRIAEGDAVRVDEGLPASYARRIFAFALDQEGSPHLAVDATTAESAGNYPGGVEHAVRKDSAWAISEVYGSPDKYVPVVDIDIAEDNTPQIWILGDPLHTVAMASPGEHEAWESTAALGPAEGGGFRHFTLTTLGQSAGLDFVRAQGGSGWQLTTRIGDEESALGDVVPDYFPYGYAVTRAAMPTGSPAAGPLLAVAIQQKDSLRVAWPSGSSYEEIALPTSTLPSSLCDLPTPSEGGCPAPCHEVTLGVDQDFYAIARTVDGTIWVALVRTQHDAQIHFEEACPAEIGCYCAPVFDTEDTTTSLHLFRVTTETLTAVEALTVPITPLQPRGLFTSSKSEAPLVDLRGFGSDLAVGLRTRTDLGYDAAVRVLRVDTTLL